MRRGMIHIFILYTAVYSLGYDGSLLNGLQALPAWQANFDRPKGVQLGLIAATYYLYAFSNPLWRVTDNQPQDSVHICCGLDGRSIRAKDPSGKCRRVLPDNC
jgi:hypothetical protein